MDSCAAQASRHTTGSPTLALLWLAGLLEGEGSFLKPPPSSPNCPIVSCRMTDRDVIERVAAMFGVGVGVNEKGKHRPEYAATLKGSPAVALMGDLRSLLGTRRRTAVDEALKAHTPPSRKLSQHKAHEIRTLRRRGESVSSLGRRFGVSRATVRAVLRGRIYTSLPPRPWRTAAGIVPGAIPAPPNVSVAELYWLAGWLEAEGSFSAPPPSDPRRPRISGQSRDRDVIERVARILTVSAVACKDPRAAERRWSPMYEVLKRGRGAVEIMGAIEPLMGTRRRAQIQRALGSWPLPLGKPGGELASTWS